MIRLFLQFLLLAVIYLVTWMSGLALGFWLFATDMISEGQEVPFDNMIFAVSALHAGILFIYLKMTRERGWSLILRLALISFGLTYLITQVESLWFMDQLGMEVSMIFALLCGGLFTSFLFAWAAVRIAVGGMPEQSVSAPVLRPSGGLTAWISLVVMLVIIWPMIYFLAGYYIAWQSEAVRMYYSSSDELQSIYTMMVINLRDGLYGFQVLRSLVWVALAFLIIKPVQHHSLVRQILITGGLFALLGSSQLLLDNPAMPEEVRHVHLVETAVSTFIWGGILVVWIKRFWLRPHGEGV